MNRGDPSDSNPDISGGAGIAAVVQGAVNKVWMEGYLSKMGTTKSIMSSSVEWNRRYFVLKVPSLDIPNSTPVCSAIYIKSICC
jgi:hypothetical protein